MSPNNSRQKKTTLAEQLRAALADSGLSHYRIAKETGVSQPIITRFVNGTRGLSLETADRLAAYFGMRFTPPTSQPQDEKSG